MSELDTLVEVLGLKALDRAGWARAGVGRPESVAAHSWGVAWLVLLFLPDELDRDRALAYAVLHDLAEVRVGDLTPHDGVSKAEKTARETTAITGLLATLPRGESLLQTWHDYENEIDAEARFVRQLDRLDMALQAERYRREGASDVGEFVESAAQAIVDERLRRVLKAVQRVGAASGRDR